MKLAQTLRPTLALAALAVLSACGSDRLDIPNALPIVQATLPTSKVVLRYCL